MPKEEHTLDIMFDSRLLRTLSKYEVCGWVGSAACAPDGMYMGSSVVVASPLPKIEFKRVSILFVFLKCVVLCLSFRDYFKIN